MKIEMKGINKSFGQNQVLKDAGFVLDDGEVHALMGENGAGKSTLMKILTGVYTRDGGTVIVDGKEVTYKSPQEAEQAGIVFIQQELNVLFDLTVEENLFLGKEIKKGFGICDRKAMRAKAEETLKRLELLEEVDMYCPAWDKVYDRRTGIAMIHEGLSRISKLRRCTEGYRGRMGEESTHRLFELICEESNMAEYKKNPLFMRSVMSDLSRLNQGNLRD